MEMGEILAAWRGMLDDVSALKARVDVQRVLIGNLLPAFHADTATVARVQAALEVLAEVSALQSDSRYQACVEEEIDRYLRGLQTGAGSLPGLGA